MTEPTLDLADSLSDAARALLPYLKQIASWGCCFGRPMEIRKCFYGK